MDDVSTREQLREFFKAVVEADGLGEAQRLYDCFTADVHRKYPPKDFADKTADGNLDAGFGRLAQGMKNGL